MGPIANCLVVWNIWIIFHFMGCHPNPIDFNSIIFQRGTRKTTNQQLRALPDVAGELDLCIVGSF